MSASSQIPLNHPAADIRSASGIGPGFFQVMDRLLRERDGFFNEIFANRDLGRRLRWFLGATMILNACYGATMGIMGIQNAWGQGLLQMLTSAVKVPLLFLLSLAVCFPVLYIVLVLMEVRLSFKQTLSLILMALTLDAVLMASCAPIILFFVLTGADYNFIKLLHVAVFTFSGAWAMRALWQGLTVTCEKSNLYPKQAVRILQVWILVFGFVGTQMAWSLRPFVGSPGLEYQLFRRNQEGNFYGAVWHAAVNMGREAVEKAGQD
jgi:hypothetical protein